MNMQKILPGILDQNFEFFNHQQENDVKYFHNGKLSSFTSLPSPIYALIKTTIDQSQKVSTILKKWFPNSEFHQIKKFLSCRFGGVDFKADIENGQLQKGEYWNCPNSGNCEAEGILCNALKINGHIISKLEIELIRLSTTDKTNDVIADELNLPLGTYHKMKKILHEKLGNIQTKQSLTKLAYQWNII